MIRLSGSVQQQGRHHGRVKGQCARAVSVALEDRREIQFLRYELPDEVHGMVPGHMVLRHRSRAVAGNNTA